MNNITDLILRLPSVTAVSITASAKVPELFSLRDLTYHLQMGYYWLKYANEEMKKLNDSVVLQEDAADGDHRFVVPTLLGIPEQLKYMKDYLTEYSTDIQTYIEEIPMPPTVKYKAEQAYNNIMLALFNTDLSTTYYGQLAKQREREY